jgi:hypothetical protein
MLMPVKVLIVSFLSTSDILISTQFRSSVPPIHAPIHFSMKSCSYACIYSMCSLISCLGAPGYVSSATQPCQRSCRASTIFVAEWTRNCDRSPDQTARQVFSALLDDRHWRLSQYALLSFVFRYCSYLFLSPLYFEQMYDFSYPTIRRWPSSYCHQKTKDNGQYTIYKRRSHTLICQYLLKKLKLWHSQAKTLSGAKFV